MFEAKRDEARSEASGRKNILEERDAEAGKIARRYSLSFQATLIAIIAAAIAVLTFGNFHFLVVLLISASAIWLTYMFFAMTAKTWKPSEFYEQYYDRERKRLRKRFSYDVQEDEAVSADTESGEAAGVEKSRRKVFIVHGHDEANREKTARFVERLGLEAIILKEQASGGNTIIEKLEEYSEVDYAIVLMTPDDVGGAAKNPADIKPRARQNVIVELGYMIAKLGRRNVCLLNRGVEIPSDFYGVVFVELDDGEDWKIGLAKEMKNAGLNVDMNRVF